MMMKKTLTILFLTLLFAVSPAVEMQAAGGADFVARMMKQIVAAPATYSESDYVQTTVSPKMMQSVIEKLTSGEMTSVGQDAGDVEIMTRLLRDVKSLRVFMTTANAPRYRKLADCLLRDNKNRYKMFASEPTGQSANTTRIWTRKSGNRVVEIIAIVDEHGQAAQMRILNFTGNFSDDFVGLLGKLNDK